MAPIRAASPFNATASPKASSAAAEGFGSVRLCQLLVAASKSNRYATPDSKPPPMLSVGAPMSTRPADNATESPNWAKVNGTGLTKDVGCVVSGTSKR